MFTILPFLVFLIYYVIGLICVSYELQKPDVQEVIESSPLNSQMTRNTIIVLLYIVGGFCWLPSMIATIYKQLFKK